MVQIIPANPRRSRGEQISEGLIQGLRGGLQLYGEHQKQKQFGEALKGVENIYSDPSLSQEQKFIKSFSSLSEFPEVQKQFAQGLSIFSESPLQAAQRRKLEQEIDERRGEEDFISRLMGGQETQQPTERPSGIGADFSPEEEKDLAVSTKKSRAQPEFDYRNPSTWTDRQIDQFRSLEGRSSKAKTLARTAQNEFERREESKKARTKYQENVAPLHSAIETIDQMVKLGKKGNLGIGTTVRGILSPQARRDAAEYERLGKSLIQYSSNIPIRNRQEFETLAHDLYDPSISDDSRAGILAAMKRIIQNSMAQYEKPEEEQTLSQSFKSVTPIQRQKRPITSFLKG